MSNDATPPLDDAPVFVQTVTGPLPVDELGMTLPHEHIFNDLSEAFYLSLIHI